MNGILNDFTKTLKRIFTLTRTDIITLVIAFVLADIIFLFTNFHYSISEDGWFSIKHIIHTSILLVLCVVVRTIVIRVNGTTK